MSIQLLIDSVDYTASMITKTLVVQEGAGANGQTCDFVLNIVSGVPASPACGQVVQLYVNSILSFAGRIDSWSIRQESGPLTLQYNVHVVDWINDFDAKLLNEVFPAQNVGDVVRHIVGIVGKGFTSAGVADGPILDERVADLELPSQFISKLADAIEHQWNIDYDRDIHFYYLRDLPAPITQIAVDTDLATYWNVVSSYDCSQVKNRIFVDGAKVKSQSVLDLSWKADGSRAIFTLPFEPWSVADTTITVDGGAAKTIRIEGLEGHAGDGEGTASEVYMAFDDHFIRFPDLFKPADNAIVRVVYYYLYQPVVVVEDVDSIEALRLLEDNPLAPHDGVHEVRFNIPAERYDSEDVIFEYAQLLLARYKDVKEAVTFESIVQGWQVGQNLRVFSTLRGYDDTFFVQTLTKNIFVHNATETLWHYSIAAANTPFPS